MSPKPVNPVLCLDDQRLKSLIFEIIGAHQVSTIQLRRGSSICPLQHSLQLCLRLTWIFEALVPAPPTVDGPTMLRILILLLQNCSSNDLNVGDPEDDPDDHDYRTWRQIALDAIVAAVRMIHLSRYKIKPQEEDMVVKKIKQMESLWRARMELSLLERLLLVDIIPRTISRDVGTQQPQGPIEGEAELLADSILYGFGNKASRESFWRLYDWTCLFRCSVTMEEGQNERLRAIMDSKIALPVIHRVLEKAHLRPGDGPTTVVLYQMGRLLASVRMEEDASSGNSLSDWMNRTVESELEEFCQAFSLFADNSVSRWVHDRQVAGLPLSMRSPSHGSPIDSKMSVISVSKSIDPVPRSEPDHSTSPGKQELVDVENAERDTYQIFMHSSPEDTQIEAEHLYRDDTFHHTASVDRNGPQDTTSILQGPNTLKVFPPAGLEALITPLSPSHHVRTSNLLAAEPGASSDAHLPITVPHSTPPSLHTPDDHFSKILAPGHAESIRAVGRQLPTCTFSPAFTNNSTSTPSQTHTVVSRDSQLWARSPSPGLEPVENAQRFSERPPSQYQLNMPRDLYHDGGSPTSDRRGSSLSELAVRPASITSSRGSDASRKRRSIFGKLLSGSSKPTLEPLPPDLQYKFSSSGTCIIFWRKKDAEHIVRVPTPFLSGETIPLIMPLNPSSADGKLPGGEIRFLACSGNDNIAAVVHIGNARWIYCLNEDRLQPMRQLDNSTPNILALSLSPDGTTVALACGRTIQIYRMLNGRLHDPMERVHPGDPGSQPCVHILSFSPDSRRIVSAIQVQDTREAFKHLVYPAVWAWVGSDIELESELKPISIDVSVDKGVSSVWVFGDSVVARKVFLTAFLSTTKYYSILPVAAGPTYGRLRNIDARISSCVQCLFHGSSHTFVATSGPDEVIHIDAQSGTAVVAADFSAERKYRGCDSIAIGMQGSDSIHALWRTKDQTLVLKKSVLVRGRWTTSSVDVDLGYVYRSRSRLG